MIVTQGRMPGGGSNRTGSAKAVRSAFATGHDQRGSVLISAGFIVIWPADYRQKQSGTVRWREVGLNWLSLREQGQRRFAIEGTARWRRGREAPLKNNPGPITS